MTDAEDIEIELEKIVHVGIVNWYYLFLNLAIKINSYATTSPSEDTQPSCTSRTIVKPSTTEDQGQSRNSWTLQTIMIQMSFKLLSYIALMLEF